MATQIQEALTESGIGGERSQDSGENQESHSEGSPSEEHFRSEREMRERILEAREEGDRQKAESLHQALQTVKKIVSEDNEIFDTRLLGESESGKAGAEAKNEELLKELETEVTGAAISEGYPSLDKGAMELDTYRLVPNGEGGLRKMHLPEKSAPRYLLAGFLKQRSVLNMDILRLQVVEPVRSQGLPPQSESRQKAGIPYPENESELGDQRIGDWQSNQVRSRAEEWAAERGYMCIKPEEASRAGCPAGTQAYTMTLLKEEEARPLSDERLEQLHYLGGLVSGGGTVPNGNTPPDPDYREGLAFVLEPDEISFVTEILSAGPFGGIVDGGCPAIPSEDSEGTYRSQEFQARWAISVDGLFKATTKAEAWAELEDVGLAKGTARFYKRWVCYRRLQQASRRAEELEKSLDPKAQKKAHGLRVAIGRIEQALDSGEDVYFLAKGDQVKVTPEGHDELCRVAVCGTFLRGETRDLKPADAEQEVTTVRAESGPAHVSAGKPRWRIKPSQFRVVLNSQVFQTVRPQKVPELKRHLIASLDEIGQKMADPAGWAELVSEETHLSYQKLMEEGQSGTVTQNHQLLRTALHTGAVQLRTADARERKARGEKTYPADVATLPGVKGRLGALVGAQVRNVALRGFGARGYGYLHATVENSVERCTHLWGTDRAETIDFEDGTYRRRLVNPICDDSACVLPKRITGLMNADDDGDITMGLSATVTLSDGQIAKAVLLWRYPCVDEPIIWLLPPKTETPFDSGSEEERDRFERIVNIFDPQKPEGADLFDDSITIADAQGSWRLADVGAKSQVDKERIRGDATPESSFLFARRQADLNRAGPLTRALERFFELTKEADQRAQDAEGEEAAYWQRQREDFLRRARSTQVIIEEQLSAFKYETGGDGRSPGFVPQGDPFCDIDDDNVRDIVLPMEYHDALQQIGGVKSSGADQISLERLSRKAQKGKFPTGRGRFAKMFEDILAGPAERLIIERFEQIEFDPKLFTGELMSQLKEWEQEATPDQVREVNRESREVLQAIGLWKNFWGSFLERMDQKRQAAQARGFPSAEIEDWIQERVSRGRSAIRTTIQALCRDVSKEALMSGILQNWKSQLQMPEEYQSFAPGLVLAEDRLGDVFPAAHLEYEERTQTDRGVVAYVKGRDLPGEIDEEQPCVVTPHEDDLYMVTDSDAVYQIHAADGEVLPDLSGPQEATFQRSSRRRCLIRAKR